MNTNSKTPMSDLIDKTIYEMILETRTGINTEYTILIRQIIKLYDSLYSSSDKENKAENEMDNLNKIISQKANIYMRRITESNTYDSSIDMSDKNNILNFKCYELVNRYINLAKLQESLWNN